ncbi:hypothetical protein [Bradyrhizobium sp. NAS96.2]|uniref:hypothetical protein n=1 Tax=Bradyrhizobium sp. NAS96.2 TaxID=1680160 RepID=UPI0009698C57|nr:hypothetical protein [Bradyrhizobium sp. NAS96.2]OKO76371.1 hypothetical protein AC628_18125 [Bradyrhizobium sp. NAS96.2]
MQIWVHTADAETEVFSSNLAAEEWAASNGSPERRIIEKRMENRISQQPPIKRVTVRAAEDGSFTSQRGGKGDCVIASVATALKLDYQAVAQAFDVALDEKGVPVLTGGIYDFSIFGVLLNLGWLTCPLIPSELDDDPTQSSVRQPSRDEIRELIKGRRAIICYNDETANFHAIAWNGEEAIDCSDGMIIDVSELSFQHVLVFEKSDRAA